jgi:hypothetical protein
MITIVDRTREQIDRDYRRVERICVGSIIVALVMLAAVIATADEAAQPGADVARFSIADIQQILEAFPAAAPTEAPGLLIEEMEAVPVTVWQSPTERQHVRLTYRGEAWDGPTTEFRGMVVANAYTMFQHPGKYTWGEWTTGLVGALVTGYVAYEATDSGGGGGSSGRLPPADVYGNDGNSGAGGNSLTINGNIVNSTVFVQQGSNDPQGEGHNSQGTSNSDGTVSSEQGK